MSTLWTPSGERPVGRQPQAGAPAAPPSTPRGGAGDPGGSDEWDEAAAEAHLDELRHQLASAPAAVVVANHCYGLFELAAVYLSQAPPRFADAQLAIDALGAIIETLGERLDESRASMQEALAQIRMAFVQLKAAEAAAQVDPPTSNGATVGATAGADQTPSAGD